MCPIKYDHMLYEGILYIRAFLVPIHFFSELLRPKYLVLRTGTALSINPVMLTCITALGSGIGPWWTVDAEVTPPLFSRALGHNKTQCWLLRWYFHSTVKLHTGVSRLHCLRWVLISSRFRVLQHKRWTNPDKTRNALLSLKQRINQNHHQEARNLAPLTLNAMASSCWFLFIFKLSWWCCISNYISLLVKEFWKEIHPAVTPRSKVFLGLLCAAQIFIQFVSFSCLVLEQNHCVNMLMHL